MKTRMSEKDVRSLDKAFWYSGSAGDVSVQVGLCRRRQPRPNQNHYFVQLITYVSRRGCVVEEALIDLEEAHQLGECLTLLSAIGLGETILESPPRPVTYAATLEELRLLADVTAQLDHVKNLLQAERVAVAESAALVKRAHTTLERILGDDVALVYSPDDMEKTT